MFDFDTLRNSYPEFIYKSYDISKTEKALEIKYNFEITGLTSFSPSWTFPLPAGECKIDEALLNNLVFSLGMVELVSYWKCTCSPLVRVLPCGLDDEMKRWWKSLYFGGLGEFFYTNGIRTDIKSFMEIKSDADVLPRNEKSAELCGNLVPVGGGKDSSVTISVLKGAGEDVSPYIINSRGATEDTCVVASLLDKTYRATRRLDPNLLDLNKKGFLNGHTPFSAIVAFSSLISALINSKKYVVLSNESSANESTVAGEDVNHQFSKGEAFERSFIEYQEKYINSGVYYFSLLRPLSEMKIAHLFSKFKEYHGVFKSCNVGSKSDIWCCNCPKCLFVYIILSPFLSTAEMINIFGENLLDKESLLKYYKELLGILPNKPFECVGSRDEVVSASFATLRAMEERGEKLPCLIEYFKAHFNTAVPVESFLSYFDEKNHLPPHFMSILKNAIEE